MTHKRRYGKFLALSIVSFLIVGVQQSAEAESVSITARFKPDSAQPHQNKFENTTPPSGYCATFPEECASNQMFSLQVPIEFNSRAPIAANHSSPRSGAMLTVPSQWRDLTVYHESTHEPETVRVRIAGIGSRYVTQDVMQLVGGADNYTLAHGLLWGASWVYAPAPCVYSGVGLLTNISYKFFWKTPSQGECAKQAKFDVPWLRFEYLDFAYELETPNPLGMKTGQYVGALTYTVGPGGDFDMGDVMLPSSSTLTLNFNLDVQHTLKVDIPPGGNKVELVPEGGWQNWLQNGRKPVRLFRDQTFNISASSRFKMILQCNVVGFQGCQIRDRLTGRNANVNIRVSLPDGLTDLTGQPVKRLQLIPANLNPPQFQPAFYVDRAPGVLHFEIDPIYMDLMVRPGEAGDYVGTATVIWDSEV
ncbi:hypothetical protein PMI36_03145 [Pseudomonas sp. GM79]|uniref:hypothetical protein n=1 Tax=Pseudomonas sp. GM79 TaxID=1144338 RepID=UPI00026F61EA|nr:hypothetical protein [Pseudomonas sp. GM79]EJN22447.1 hypothetical protein PMI36_03145 [Pseudomonas sp. GM79]